MFKELKNEFPALDNYQVHPLNEHIAEHLSLFVNNPKILLAALLQNPFGITPEANITSDFDSETSATLKVLNQLQDHDEEVFSKFYDIKPIVILFLTNFYAYFKHHDEYPEIKDCLAIDRVKFAMRLLEMMDISEIRSELEDRFFSIIEPEVFNHYSELLKFTKAQYLEREYEIKEKMQKLLLQTDLDFTIQSRIKSIFSIHRKILKKKILYSQVLDTVGFRIIVNSEKDCYSLMAIILKNWPIMSNKVKDYIAVPKANGYKSIHLTIIEKEQPVEIQIRTAEMNDYAQYGLAAHHQYKQVS